VTKDEDFVNSFLIVRRPLKLLLISTGNITNRDLEGIFVPNIPAITLALLNHHYVELTRTAVIIHV
jgi:predicted nuclease of predicted toxin-antitoxin system